MLSTLPLWQHLLARLPRPATKAVPERVRPLPGFTLPYRSARTVHLRAGECLSVRAGQLWLTRSGEPLDQVLQPGTSHLAQHDEAVVVEGFSVQTCLYDVQRVRRTGAHR